MDAKGPRVMIIHCPDLRGSSTQQDAYSSGIMRGFEVLIDVSGLKGVKLPEESHGQAESTMLELRLSRLMIHDPVARVLHLIDIR